MRPVLWFAAGAIAAGSVALLLAPVSGKQLRRRIAKMLDDGLDDAKHVGKAVETSVEGAVAEVKKTVIKSNGPATEQV